MITASPLTDEQRERLACERLRLDELVQRAQQQPEPILAPEIFVPRHHMETEQRVCETCGKPFTATVGVLGSLRIVGRNCQPCCEEFEARQRPDPTSIQTARVKSWEALCPAEYQTSDESRVRFEVGAALFDELMAWDCSRGLRLIGSTGRCKTRILFLLLRKRHMAGKAVRYINAVNFADDLADAYGRGSEDAERWMKAIERAPLLFIDDLGKEKVTERVETFYYRVTEYRTSNGLPIFFTSNLGATALQAHWDDAARRGGFWADRASAIVRRLKDRCKAFQV